MPDRDQTVTTPSGIVIEYFAGPHQYRIDGENVPSVSTVMNVLDKPALPWWGMKVGAGGAVELFQQKHLRVSKGELQVHEWPEPPKGSRSGAKFLEWLTTSDAKPYWVEATMDSVVSAMTHEKLTTNHVRDKRGEHGNGAHEMFEAWTDTGILPDPSQIEDPEEAGRVVALRAFCEAARIEDAQSELIVGSRVHRVAGRSDLRCKLYGDLVVSLSPLRLKTFAGEPVILDVKSGKSVYESQYLQLEGYEGLSVESGYPPTKWRLVLHLKPSGNYRLHRSVRTFEEFVACRPAVDVVNAPGTRW
jgi:hypothetical protein